LHNGLGKKCTQMNVLGDQNRSSKDMSISWAINCILRSGGRLNCLEWKILWETFKMNKMLVCRVFGTILSNKIILWVKMWNK
jgi:hypothetical protein